MKIQQSLAHDATVRANKKYNANYDNVVYVKAISGKSSGYANALVDEALALCGDPHYEISNRDWSEAAANFLVLFI